MSNPSLIELGFRPFFQQQLSLDELNSLTLGRIIEQHRSHVVAMSEQGALNLTQTPNSERVCVGDWILFDESLRLVRPLERQSLFQRKAAGTKVDSQLIAANLDSVFIVCSLNDDFNLNRIERYLAIAKEAEVEPIVVLTKLDQCADADEKRQQVQALDPLLLVHALNALDSEHIKELSGYCKSGKTVALLGSSGVGKSTLVNGLLGQQVMETGGIREDDSKGRHTTTYRAIKWLPQGGLLMDTPGMRELQLSDCEDGLKETFSEIEALAQQCRFNNCRHEREPSCAVQAAIEDSSLDQRRFNNYQKLMREQAFNSATLAEKRAKDKAFGKMVNTAVNESHARKKRN
ncbi:ribosome small subunit-dependent GTPase A [Photobacterium frigidiphilum]|uniref:Small ribosomal subunit biogenesis GTPase RsgA n=1 Tax=Photobacterium frigidiphilum TaxID=264736 RepID=A0A2T3J7F6_9GAMM|nr:ribosome small subunit-dependent GTPase A [Photobacterium frigidiphilum]PSU44631.1 ribosome small subunit-dependent GTPase A [Photobacterium frigidiphilum]